MLNITTLATWLCVAGFGSIGILLPGRSVEPLVSQTLETQLIRDDITLGSEQSETMSDAAATLETDAMPVPPVMPGLSALESLPDIPNLPARPTQPKSTTASTRSTKTTTGKPAGNAARGGNANGSGMSESSRLAAGRMSSPSYPPEAKRKNQTGTVVVEFTVDASGHVISAFAKSSSGWPLLDSEAVRTVRRWTFPAGGVMTLRRPIVFQLR